MPGWPASSPWLPFRKHADGDSGRPSRRRRSSRRRGEDTESAPSNPPRWVSRFTDDSGSGRSAIRSGCTSGVHSHVETLGAALAIETPTQVNVVSVGAILIAALCTAQHVDILVVVGKGDGFHGDVRP